MTSPSITKGAKSHSQKAAVKTSAAGTSGAHAIPQSTADEQPTQAVQKVSDLWHRIYERKLVQWALAYIGVSVGLLHGIELVGHPFHWPLSVTRIVIGVLIIGFFVALTFAWYHGEKGHQRFTQGETTIIALLLLIGSGMLIIFAKPDAGHETNEPIAAIATEHAALSATATKTGQLRLAVLPFENQSPAPENAFFTDGMHEEILSTLASRAANIGVISRTTMMLYRTSPKSVADLAKELGVTHVLEGSVRREGQLVRVSLQLIDARTDRPMWSKHYDRQLVNAIALQSQVATEVAAQLATKLFENEKATPITTSPEAYDLYLKGKLAVRGASVTASASEYARIESLFNRAIELDPQFAAAYLERAQLRITLRTFSLDLGDANGNRIKSDIAKARELVGATAPVLLAESGFTVAFSGDLPRALELIDAAEALGPLNADGLSFKAAIVRALGRYDDAIVLFSRAGDLDPSNRNIFLSLSGLYWSSRRPAEAFQVLRAFNERSEIKLPKGDVIFAFTGQSDELAGDIAGLRPDTEIELRLERQFHLARVQNRIGELVGIIDRSGVKELRQFGWSGFVLPQVGRKPVAELYGWAKLLNGDRAGAVSDGRALLKFVERQTVTTSNDWYLHVLAAEGWLFSGDAARATTEARVALTKLTGNRPPNVIRQARGTAAMIFAWAGEETEAIALLEKLSTEFPGVGPAVITRDPLYSIPLAKSAPYKVLAAKLEAEIADNLKLPQ